MSVAAQSMLLTELLELHADVSVGSSAWLGVTDDSLVTGVCLDSRLACAGDLYIAIEGATTHGMNFIDAALIQKVAAVVTDKAGAEKHAEAIQQLHANGIPVLVVNGLKAVVGDIAAKFYGQPSKALQVIAVTGTDGKTSVCRFIAEALSTLGQACGYIGTLGWGLHALQKTELTTPDAVTLQRMLAALKADGASHVALEASSHGIAEGRLDAVEIDIAVLTNIGRDHLDYHKTADDYRAAKARLFTWPDLHSVVLNSDDSLGQQLLQQTNCNTVTFATTIGTPVSLDTDVELQACDIELHRDGMSFELIDSGDVYHIETSLVGRFNVDNLLACHGVLRALGHAANDASMALQSVNAVAGRMEQIHCVKKAAAIIDYAHTPQALDAALASAREHCNGKLWVVFGCGGDRDPGKRAPMGRSAEVADHIVVTDDNPRTENSTCILEQIVAGMERPQKAIVIADRAEAIAYALQHAQVDDLILIAGKGHEDYQVIGTEKRRYSDREVVQRVMQEAS